MENWPLVVVKELVDNALDDAEKTGVAPEIEIAVTNASITVADQGSASRQPPSRPSSIIPSACRPSRYVSPTRGQQGNALQILFAMPYVLNGKEGEVLIESRGVAHAISFTTDPVRQTPVVSRADFAVSGKKRDPRHGALAQFTKVKARRRRQRIFIARRTLRLVQPAPEPEHEPASRRRADIVGGDRPRVVEVVAEHAYLRALDDAERLKLLMTAYIAHAEDHRTACLSVRDFIGLFRGLSGTAKQNAICKAVGVAERTSLADFYQQRHRRRSRVASSHAKPLAPAEAPRPWRDRTPPSSRADDRARL